jgi:hypothetical protein
MDSLLWFKRDCLSSGEIVAHHACCQEIRVRTAINRLLRVVLTVASVVALTAAAGPGKASEVLAQQAAALYRSEQYDWFFFYDASEWSIEEESSQSDSEVVRFSDGESVVTYSTFDAHGSTPRECVKEVVNTLSEDLSILDVAALSDVPGPPEIVGGDGSSFVYTVLVVTADSEDGPSKLASVETCASVGDGRALVYRSINVPAATYNERQGRFDSPEIVSSVQFADLFDPGFAPTVPEPVPIADANGVVIGSLAGRLECESPGPFLFVATGLGESGFAVDPDAFVVFDPGSVRVLSSTIEWLSPAIAPPDVVALDQGDPGLFQLVVSQDGPEFSGSFNVYYRANGQPPVFLGSASGPCAGSGAGAPVLIDIE